MAKVKQTTYSQALSELEKIVSEIETEKVDVDLLAEKVKRASSLIKFCKSRLRSAGDEIKKALGELEERPRGEERAGEENDGY